MYAMIQSLRFGNREWNLFSAYLALAQKVTVPLAVARAWRYNQSNVHDEISLT